MIFKYTSKQSKPTSTNNFWLDIKLKRLGSEEMVIDKKLNVIVYDFMIPHYFQVE